MQAVTVGSLHDHQVTAGFAVEHSHQEIEVIIIPYDLLADGVRHQKHRAVISGRSEIERVQPRASGRLHQREVNGFGLIVQQPVPQHPTVLEQAVPNILPAGQPPRHIGHIAADGDL